VIAFADGDVARAVSAHPQGLTPVRRFTAEGQPPVTIYVSDGAVAQPPRSAQHGAAAGVSIGLEPVHTTPGRTK